MDSKAFLSTIWPTTLVRSETLELRAINRKDGTINRQFYTSIDNFLEAANKYKAPWDIYFGVSTRFDKGGKKRDCYRVRCVWMDLDKGELPDFGVIKPDLIINSGSGFHVYWLLTDPVFVRSGRWVEIEAINRALVKKFGGDIASIDVSRILRVPGFNNYKYDPPRMVECIKLKTSSD